MGWGCVGMLAGAFAAAARQGTSVQIAGELGAVILRIPRLQRKNSPALSPASQTPCSLVQVRARCSVTPVTRALLLPSQHEDRAQVLNYCSMDRTCRRTTHSLGLTDRERLSLSPHPDAGMPKDGLHVFHFFL